MNKVSGNLMDSLGVGLLPEREFSSIMAAHFPEVSQRDWKVITYGRDGVKAIDARYKNGVLIALTQGPALRSEDVATISARVQSEAAETRECVRRAFVFSLQRTDGVWRYRDRFQLLPAGPEAPDVPFSYGAHPLILEYKVRWSDDLTLFTMRWTDTQTRIVLLLNAFLRFGLTHVGFRSQHRWVVGSAWPLGGGQAPENRTLWASDGYLVPEFIADAEVFSPTDQFPEIPTLGEEEHYSGDARVQLVLPSYLEPAVNCYEALPEPDKQIFNRAIYWFGHSKSIYSVSHSSAFAALVQAIESLVPSGDKSKSTARFIEFLTSIGLDKKTCDTFYSIRSDILHGSRVLLYDFEGLFAGGLHHGTAEFYFNYDECERAARLAMLSWLAQRVSAVAENRSLSLSPRRCRESSRLPIGGVCSDSECEIRHAVDERDCSSIDQMDGVVGCSRVADAGCSCCLGRFDVGR
jgi:hypothetical protein